MTLTQQPKSPVVPALPIYRLTVEQYHQMAAAGILSEDDPVELLDGFLVLKMTKNKPHVVATRRTRHALERSIPAGWSVDSQDPITIGVGDEPEPDVFVARVEAA